MPESITLRIDGAPITVVRGTSVAAAVMIAGKGCRSSVTGEPRGPLCGMGTCFECRLAINGIPHCRSCQIPCEDSMEVSTDG
jgi:sarcosine oxidase subunit alpha